VQKYGTARQTTDDNMAHGPLKTTFTSLINNINIQTHPRVIIFPWQKSYMDAPRCTFHVGYITCLLSISVDITLHYITLHNSTYFDVIGQSLVKLNILMLMEY
jgi:hypothetical protein